MIIGYHFLAIWYNLCTKYGRVKSRFIVCKITLIYRKCKRSTLIFNISRA
uniref:Uncharacterized protein n=1 Tax=Podoviridae sp. ctsNK10 TaxID=2826582 RepID=A0A8S5NLF0_9CAUD|nr:MAG TPA: hypothetical protein [Podoviridae sp. ctsNK10]DAJ73278.1 MAG TPA: hypothetical protein [Caudoviricetes sp.]